jgi:hypothetical protein
MPGYVIGRDFVATWIGARSALALNPAAWFAFDAFNAGLEAMFYQGFPVHNWSYPPHLLLMTWPLGFLPYMPAYIAWCVGGLALSGPRRTVSRGAIGCPCWPWRRRSPSTCSPARSDSSPQP